MAISNSDHGLSVVGPIEVIIRTGVLPIARGLSRDVLLSDAGARRSAGINVIEITLDSPDAFGTVRALRAQDGQLTVGAGTVRSDELARQAVEAGAQFLVTPHVDKRVAEEATRLKVPVILGALTPTEIGIALDLGAVAVGVGGVLLGAPASDTQWLTAQAHALIAAVQQGRRGGVARHA